MYIAPGRRYRVLGVIPTSGIMNLSVHYMTFISVDVPTNYQMRSSAISSYIIILNFYLTLIISFITQCMVFFLNDGHKPISFYSIMGSPLFSPQMTSCGASILISLLRLKKGFLIKTLSAPYLYIFFFRSFCIFHFFFQIFGLFEFCFFVSFRILFLYLSLRLCSFEYDSFVLHFGYHLCKFKFLTRENFSNKICAKCIGDFLRSCST